MSDDFWKMKHVYAQMNRAATDKTSQAPAKTTPSAPKDVQVDPRAIDAVWKPIGVVVEGRPISIQGINPWDFNWREVEHVPLELPHPNYPDQRHEMTVYEIDNAGQKVRFAAGELSANVWGFYVSA